MAAVSKQPTLSQSKGAKNDHDDEIFRIGEIDSASWRLRDMSHRILYHRYGPESDTVAPRQSSGNMHTSNLFDRESCLARLRRERAGVARSAFDAAATAVLEAVEKSLEQHAKKYRRKSMTFEQDELPPFLTEWLKLEELRLGSLERAHNNKDYAKQPLAPGARKIRKPKETSVAVDAPSENSTQKDAAREAPKFTRNTPASSAAALDSRQTNSRAMLCVAGNVCFDALTPPLPGFDMDVTDIPQNPANGEGSSSTVNMGNVVVEAQAMGQRAIAVAVNGSRRSFQRYQYRKDNLRFDLKRNRKSFFRMKNPFQLKGLGEQDDRNESIAFETAVPYQPIPDAVTEAWSENCLPRFLSILKDGASHSLYHDIEWWTRHGRIANLFQVMAQEQENFGTHLIITTEPEVVRFAQEFQPVNRHQTLLAHINAESLRALIYSGDRDLRRRLRSYFPKATGLVESPFHVLITSYKAFLEDYLHFCQVPFETVVVDDGASWMAAARGDPNSPVGTLWDTAIWSTKDHVGLAGTSYKRWDFTVDEIPLQAQKDAWIGLTARNRILTASVMDVQQRSSVDVIPVSGLVFFVAPHYATAVREEWDRSRIHTDHSSMEHFRKLLARSTVVHHPGEEQDMRALAMDALNGRLPSPDRASDPEVPDIIPDEQFVSDGKVAYSRRASLLWLGHPERSWLRYELGTVSFQPILNALSRSNTYGHFCEETITASCTTSSGATGQVAGTMAYRLAIHCNRHFGSEQGLRQHLSALHAPPLTWLCRTCGTDCISSQARTHHERSCGQAAGDSKTKEPIGGQGSRQHFGPVGVVGKKKGQKPGVAAAKQAGAAPEDKDPDGSFRVPGYRGVWVNPKGKHFVKVKGTIVKVGDETLFFDSIEEAAKAHDSAVKKQGCDPKTELNFQEDGTRIVYEEVTTSSTTGLGGSANNVVPALSVINIKDLPADVKPLLRDPRQTSRTGGNSKRHVYAYRGVCRQARKGHDRWQSQISFMGVNHYLGTFDSEWDAAAIYAWAHLILYGEEATRKAQKEGEEAAAAYEQEKKDIAEGKIMPPPPPKPEKKKPKCAKKTKDKKAGDRKKGDDDGKEGTSKKRKHSADDGGAGEAKKKAKPGPKPKQTVDKESIAPVLAKGAARAWSLAPREQYFVQSDAGLVEAAAPRIAAARKVNYSVADPGHPAAVDDMLRPCINDTPGTQTGAALLLGLSSALFEWSVDVFVSSRVFDSIAQEGDATCHLTAEFGEEGFNEFFHTLLQGPLTVVGNPGPATRKAHKHLGLGRIPIGSAVGEIDCSIGGTMLSCSETAASIRYAPTTAGEFQLNALNDDDIVTLNGRRITPGMGSFPLFHEDICTVGARVFVFLLPKDR